MRSSFRTLFFTFYKKNDKIMPERDGLMEVSINELLQLNNLEIYNLYKDKLDAFYHNNNIIMISYEEFKEIVIDEIDDLKKDYKGNNFFNSLIKNVEIRIKEDNDLFLDHNYNVYTFDIKNRHLLSNDETLRLIEKVQKGDKDAKQLLIQHNIRLVLFTAKKYLGLGVDFDDLVQEGTIGLSNAIDKYDKEKGAKFSTYALYWIKSSIYKALYNSSRTIRIPNKQIEDIIKYKKVRQELVNELNREVSIDEIAERMTITRSKCVELFLLQDDIVSLNKNISDDNKKTELGDFIESDINVEKTTIDNLFVSDLKKALNNSGLTDKEKYVLIHRYSLFGYKKMTLNELGKMFDLSRERVRQIEISALRKLKNSKDGSKLVYYMNDSIDSNNKKEQSEKYNDIKSKIPREYFDYLFDCGLDPIEMYILSLSLGLINNKAYNNREITNMTGKTYLFITNTISNAISKLKNDENKEKLFNHANNVIKEKKIIKKVTPKKSIYEVIRCTESELNKVVNLLSENELILLNKRKSKTYQLTMSKEEKENFKVLLKKIRNILKSSNNKSQEIVKELNDIKNNLEKFKSNTNSELYSIIEKIINTKVFKELNKYFSIKETIAIMLLNGYVYDSMYSADYVAKLLNIDLTRIFYIFKKSLVIIKYLNYNDIEEVKELTKN